MTKNPYLSWLKDEDLFRAIRHVYNKYSSALKQQSLRAFTRNIIDPFIFVFDMTLTDKDSEDWIMEESARQLQKTLNNAVGEFHQIILGSCEGWEDLGVGDDSHLDLKKSDGTVFAEIKNKYNTMNSSSEKSVFEKLDTKSKLSPFPDAYLVQIVRKSKKPYNIIWNYKSNRNANVKKISGDLFYELVTGIPRSLEQIYYILPQAIKDFIAQETSSIEVTESRLWEEIQSQIGKKDLSNSDLIPYFFKLAYSDRIPQAVRETSLVENDAEEDDNLEIDDDTADELDVE
jgi:Eco47II restriction endonuclease